MPNCSSFNKKPNFKGLSNGNSSLRRLVIRRKFSVFSLGSFSKRNSFWGEFLNFSFSFSKRRTKKRGFLKGKGENKRLF